MAFDLSPYSETVRAILSLDGAGERLMPLVAGKCSSAEAAARIRTLRPADIFPAARSPEGALAALWVYFSAFDEGHRVAQDLTTVEGSYWHAILHRQEPDAWNSGYWFRRVGSHPIFPALNMAAAQFGYRADDSWDPFAFVEYCDTARLKPGSEQERIALQVQRAEWQLLFAWCAQPQRSSTP